MVRLVAGLSVLGAAAVFLFYLSLLGKLPVQSLEARHLRAMKDRAAAPDSIEPADWSDFLALPESLSVAEYSGLETRAVSLVGRVGSMVRSADGDLHLELYEQPNPEVGRLRYVTAEITPAWRGALPRRGADSPGWGFDRLLAIFRPDQGGATPWEDGPTLVRLSGWRMYDGLDDRAKGRLPIARRVHRLTDWEIHPVTRIERWEERLASWVEVRR